MRNSVIDKIQHFRASQAPRLTVARATCVGLNERMEQIKEKRQESSELMKAINGDFSTLPDSAEQRISTISVNQFDSGVTMSSGRDFGTGTSVDLPTQHDSRSSSSVHFGALPIRKFSIAKHSDTRATGLSSVTQSKLNEGLEKSISLMKKQILDYKTQVNQSQLEKKKLMDMNEELQNQVENL